MTTYEFTADAERIDVGVVHAFLTGSYWASGIGVETVRRAMAGSMCFAILTPDASEVMATVAFARVVTDGATFAYLADVFVLPEHRGLGLGKRLVDGVLADPRLASVRLWLLKTADAHGLYRRYGFRELKAPDRWMERAAT